MNGQIIVMIWFFKNQIKNGVKIINPFAALALFDSSSIQKKLLLIIFLKNKKIMEINLFLIEKYLMIK